MANVIKKIDGYVYLVENACRKGFETYHNMGKDLDDPRWKEEIEEVEEIVIVEQDDAIEIEPKKRKKTKKEEDI